MSSATHRSPKTRLRSWGLRLAALGIGLSIAFAVLEAYLRWFDPFPILLRGGRIDLPIHMHTEFSGKGVPGLEETIRVSFNSLGFRGPERTPDWDQKLSIICVGGSTTQCLYLSDGTTWPDQLSDKLSSRFPNIWINNAGIDGHSTFGHLQLVDQYLAAIKPRYLLLYVGLNDVDRVDLGAYDMRTLRVVRQEDDSSFRSVQRTLLRSSQAFALFDNLRLQLAARRKGLTHGVLGHGGLAKLPVRSMSIVERDDWMRSRDPSCLANYEARLRAIVDRCREAKIECILMTQAVLYGEGVDDVTGLDLETVEVGETDGWTHWRLLQQYNAVTKSVGKELGASVVDLAEQLPKSSKYFYDLTHCNAVGAGKIAEILANELKFPAVP